MGKRIRFWLSVAVLAALLGCSLPDNVPAPSRWRCQMWEGMYDLEITGNRSVMRLWADGEVESFGGRVERGITKLYTSSLPNGRGYRFEFSEDGQTLDVTLAQAGDADNINIEGRWYRIPMPSGLR